MELRCAIEFRQDESRLTPGRIVGTLMQYETRASDRPEQFKAGALEWPEGGVILNLSHDRKQPVMRFTPEVRGSAVMIDAPLPDTSRGRDAAEMVRNGTLTGLSVEFNALAEGMNGNLREVRRALLGAAALVDSPSYAASQVEVRHKAKLRVWL